MPRAAIFSHTRGIVAFGLIIYFDFGVSVITHAACRLAEYGIAVKALTVYGDIFNLCVICIDAVRVMQCDLVVCEEIKADFAVFVEQLALNRRIYAQSKLAVFIYKRCFAEEHLRPD